MENLEIWNKYKEVPTTALKDFDNGKFKGTDINTMWRLKCLTEEFGICGIGWYYKPVKMWTEKCENGDVFAFAEIELYIKVNGEWSMPISGNGGNKLVRITKNGDYSTSDEAFKMAITDAIGVACRNLGFGADVYWANDRTKYTEAEDKKDIQVHSQNKVSVDTIKVSEDVKKRVESVGGTLEKIADYYKCKVTDLTDVMCLRIVNAKINKINDKDVTV